MDIKNWFKNLIATNYFFTKVTNPSEISDPIVKAIDNKEIPQVNPDDISSPIVNALDDVVTAIESKETTFPESMEVSLKGVSAIAIKGDKGDKGENGKDGKDGYTPIKFKDYFTKDEIEKIIKKVQKSIKVPKDGEDGYTPVSGIDYPSHEQIKTHVEELVALFPVPKDGMSPEHKWNKDKTKIKFRNPDGKWGEWSALLKGKDGSTAYGLGISSFITLTDAPSSYKDKAGMFVKVNADENGVEFSDILDIKAIRFDTENTPLSSEPGLIQWNATEGTYDMGLLNSSVLQVGQETMFYGKASGAIANGDLCQFAGVQGNHILIKKAVGIEIEENPHYLVGVATENIANGVFGYVTWFGKVNNVYTKTPNNQDSSNWIAGDILYFNITTGQMTKNLPSVPNRVITVAAVIKEQTGSSESGTIIVRPTFSQKLQDLDDVNGTELTANGQIPVWNNTGKYFDFTSNILNYFYKPGISGGQTAIGGTGVTDVLNLQGTSGNGTATNAAIKLNVGNNGGTNAVTVLNNGNVGIGTTSPAGKLDIKGAGTGTGIAFQTQDSGGNVHFSVLDNGSMTLNTNGTSALFSTYKGDNSDGYNLFIGGGGQSSVGEAGVTYKGSYNTAYGIGALQSNTTGFNNTANGMYALVYNTTGYYNTANGMNSLYSNTTGNNNTANGVSALYSNTTGNNNTANGVFSLYSNTTGFNNTANGMDALVYNTTGYYNTANGMDALVYNTTGYNNTANGANSLFSNTTGYYNTAFGYQSGRYAGSGTTANETSNNSVYLGYDSRAGASGNTNEIVIGASAIGNGSNTVTLGNDSITTTILKGNVGVGTATPTAKLSVSEKSAMNELGGFMVKLTNKTGANSVKGTVVYASSTTDNAFNVNPLDGDMPCGVVYTDGIVDGSECWVTVSGIAEVLLVNGVASTRSYIAYSSATTAGRIDTSATVPAATTHFREIGHTLESKTAGTNVLCKCVLHFN